MSEVETVGLPVALVLTKGGTQMRSALDADHIKDLAEVLRGNQNLPAVEVVYDGACYWLWDGFHRHEAHRKANRDVIFCRVTAGTQRDAVLLAIGANSGARGLPRSRETKRIALRVLFEDAEWQGWSLHKIAERSGVSHTFASNLRKKEFPSLVPGEVQAQVTDDTVSADPTGNVASQRVVGKDGRTIDTGKIADANRERAKDTRLNRRLDELRSGLEIGDQARSELVAEGYLSQAEADADAELHTTKPTLAKSAKPLPPKRAAGPSLGSFAPSRGGGGFAPEAQADPDEVEFVWPEVPRLSDHSAAEYAALVVCCEVVAEYCPDPATARWAQDMARRWETVGAFVTQDEE